MVQLAAYDCPKVLHAGCEIHIPARHSGKNRSQEPFGAKMKPPKSMPGVEIARGSEGAAGLQPKRCQEGANVLDAWTGLVVECVFCEDL